MLRSKSATDADCAAGGILGFAIRKPFTVRRVLKV